jgi:hypothetical protein
VTAGESRRTALLGLKLGALVRDHLRGAALRPASFGSGVAVVHDGEAWLLPDDGAARSLGPALAWAEQHGARQVNLIVDDAATAGLLARRAGWFAVPPAVWLVAGAGLTPAGPAPFPPAPPIDERLARFVPLIEEGGAEPVVEHGVVGGEVAGLEVGRAVIDPVTGVAHLEVGVGAHDREAFQLLHGDVPPAAALAEVVAVVSRLRRRGADPHPLNRLGASRLLRSRLVDDPSPVDAVVLEPVPPPVPRASLRDEVPCVAAGFDRAGRPLVVVCSTGVDLDVVPFAADARAATGPAGARLLIVVPERDAHPVTRRLAAALAEPAEVVAVAE